MVLLLSNGYVYTKLEVSIPFIFRENRIHGTDRQTGEGQTDRRGETLNAATR